METELAVWELFKYIKNDLSMQMITNQIININMLCVWQFIELNCMSHAKQDVLMTVN